MTARASWWRRQRWYLFGAGLFGFWAFFAPLRESWRNYARSHPLVAIDVPKGAQAEYLGARWRFLNLTERDAPGLGESRMLLVARFEMTADAGTDVKSLSWCRAGIDDAHGREWEEGYASSPVPRAQRLPDSCTSSIDANFKPVLAQPGRPWSFEKSFVLPRGVDVRALRPRIFVITPTMPDAPGSYLRFTQ